MWKQWSYGRSALLRCKRACRWAFATEPSLANCAEIVRNEFAQSTVAREKEPSSEGLGGGEEDRADGAGYNEMPPVGTTLCRHLLRGCATACQDWPYNWNFTSRLFTE